KGQLLCRRCLLQCLGGRLSRSQCGTQGFHDRYSLFRVPRPLSQLPQVERCLELASPPAPPFQGRVSTLASGFRRRVSGPAPLRQPVRRQPIIHTPRPPAAPSRPSPCPFAVPSSRRRHTPPRSQC